MRIWCKAALAPESLFWRHIRGSATSWMGAGLKAKSLRGECVSDAPGRGSGGQKIQRRAPGCFSESLGILPLPARDLWTRFHQLPSENKPGTVQRARLLARRWNMAALHQQVAYFSTLEFILCVDVLQTHSKSRVQSGFNYSILYCKYWLSNRMAVQNQTPVMQHCGILVPTKMCP